MSADEISKFVCRGNADAEAFCKSFVAYCHLLDDCVDRDKPCDAERVAREAIDFIVQLTGNPFFVAHKAQLMGLIIQSFRAWADSNLAKYNADADAVPTQRTENERDVIKGFYHEVVFHVAAIIGGWEHLRKVTEMCREYDFEQPLGPSLVCDRCNRKCSSRSQFAAQMLCDVCWEDMIAFKRLGVTS